MLISKFNAIQSNTLSQLHKRLLNGCCAAVPVCGFGELGVPMMDYPSLLKGPSLLALGMALPEKKTRIYYHSSGLALPKKLKKGDKLTKAILAFALPCLLLLIQPVQGASKTPTLQYGTIGRRNNAPSTHPPPVNDPTRGCNAENGCRQFTLSLENRRGTLVEAVGNVTMAEGTLNHREPGTEAIAAGIATWFLNKTESNSNTYGRLSISQDPISSAAVSSQMLQLQAVSRGIARMGLQVYSSMSTEDNSKIPPADGNIEIKVNSTSNMVDLSPLDTEAEFSMADLRFFTRLEISLGEADIIRVLESAKNILQSTRH
ncbi:hypothetical protein F383_22288 [Gossypium arboreum]|uniref:Uncharacterized protein n=1 Tax=Gossypium arboreum TaxID=29729 RepID=A0A0B0NPZ3_GOSAR|nr:hypothetical protein F383_22288 [Gossypium arboreum]